MNSKQFSDVILKLTPTFRISVHIYNIICMFQILPPYTVLDNDFGTV